mmetsp:Transcript_43200/g.50574  ORF Transcript_43200/g.50574 Transcript_43200/m.50574 type:complete len:98 (-) Transcript_43200:137-430(-)
MIELGNGWEEISGTGCVCGDAPSYFGSGDVRGRNKLSNLVHSPPHDQTNVVDGLVKSRSMSKKQPRCFVGEVRSKEDIVRRLLDGGEVLILYEKALV